jgi:ADP-heptose:LPS heptosyltransferase
LIHRHGCRVVLVGSASEAEAIENIRLGIGGDCISLAGRTSITVLTAVLASADVALTLDTGILHIARAIELPACIIAPAWSPVEEWLPLGDSRFHILKNQDLPEAPADYIIDEVSEADVRTSMDKLLTDFPPSANSREQRMRRCMAGVAGNVTGRLVRERAPIS